jgi:hypothetical protein
MEGILIKAYGVEKRHRYRAKGSFTYQSRVKWGVSPFSPKHIDLGRGLPPHGHPINAHIEVIGLLHNTPEFRALQSALEELLLRSTKFQLVCPSLGRPLTEPEEFDALSALHKALMQFWVFSPNDQAALPFLIARLCELQGGERSTRWCVPEPVGLTLQTAERGRVRPLYVDGYFRESKDRSVVLAFEAYDAMPSGEQASLPVGFFHKLVQENHERRNSAAQATIGRTRVWPRGFKVYVEPPPERLHDPRVLSIAEVSTAVPGQQKPLTFSPFHWFGANGVVNAHLTHKFNSGYKVYMRVPASPLFSRRSHNRNFIYIKESEGAPKELYNTAHETQFEAYW